MPCENHGHPSLPTPISEDQFRDEFDAIYRGARLTGPYSLELPSHLTARHRKDPRAYAEVHTQSRSFGFAPQVLFLPEPNRLGLISHELGHILDPLATENGADRAAEQALNVRIVYDDRWPGKGLQRLALLRRRR